MEKRGQKRRVLQKFKKLLFYKEFVLKKHSGNKKTKKKKFKKEEKGERNEKTRGDKK